MSFVESLMRAAILAQEAITDPEMSDPFDDTSVVDLPVDPVEKTGPSAMILWPWFAAQLALGFVGYYIVKYDYTDPLAAARATWITGGGTSATWDALLAAAPTTTSKTGWENTRLIALITTGLGATGVVATLAGFADFFPYFTYASALGAGGVLTQAFLSRGWYDAQKTTVKTTAELVDVNYATTKNYALYGSILVLAVDAYAIVMPLLAAKPAAPEPMEEEPVEELDPTNPNASLNAW